MPLVVKIHPSAISVITGISGKDLAFRAEQNIRSGIPIRTWNETFSA